MRPEPLPSMTKPINIEADQNAWRALKLRKQGYGYRAISLKLKCSLSTAHGYVKKALDLLRAEIIEAADDLRTIEIEKLDALELQMKRKLASGGITPADSAKIAAVIVRIGESRRKLRGLDAPERVEMTGNLYTVKEASPDCAEWGEARKEPPNEPKPKPAE